MGPDQLVFLWLILGTVGVCAMVFGLRYFRNKENMAMIEKGMDPKLNARRPAPFLNLKWGLLLVGAGIGLFVAYFLATYVLFKGEPQAIYFSLLAIGGGLGLIGSYKIEKKELLDKPNDYR
ncbi:MAG: hypothetical protein QM731_11770 [Chitinophagaceae bacterium]